jgi:hypothetical protein
MLVKVDEQLKNHEDVDSATILALHGERAALLRNLETKAPQPLPKSEQGVAKVSNETMRLRLGGFADRFVLLLIWSRIVSACVEFMGKGE